jgi:hypothetical protein
MKKMYVAVSTKRAMRFICSYDLDRVYYYRKRPSPPLPVYCESTDTDESNTGIILGLSSKQK